MKNKKSLILILASLPFLSIAFYFFMIPRDSLQKGPMYELLEKKGFVYVESRYHGVGEKDAKDRFDQLLLDEFSFILSHPKLTSDQIFIESYQFTLSADEVINKDLLKERHIPKLERLYSIYQDSFKKVRISFNKENLPTKVELYYEGENGLAWYSWRTYSYPYKNEADFKEDLDSVYKIYKDQQKIEADKKKSKK